MNTVQTGNDFQISNVEGLTFGLSWDLIGEIEVDLDASCVFFDEYGRIIDAVFFNQLDIGYATHSGDNKTGEGEGFDETIKIDFTKMKPEVSSFFVIINCHSGGTFVNVETAEAKLMDLSGQMEKEVLIGCKGEHTGFLFCLCYKTFEGAWMLREVGKVCGGRNFKDAEKEMIQELRFLVPEELSNEMRFDVNNRKKFNLKKGESLGLAGIQTVVMGLGWDTNCDLDASVFEMKQDGSEITKDEPRVYFSRLENKNKSIIHQGDNTTGEGAGDDERITIHLDQVDPETHYLVLMVNVYSKSKHFGHVKGAYCRLVWNEYGKKPFEVCRYNLSNRKRGEGMVMSILYRNQGSWSFQAMGEESTGNIASLPEVIRILASFSEWITALKRMKQRFAIKFRGEPSIQVKGGMRIKCKANHVDKMDRFGKSDPYFVVRGPNGKVLGKSEKIMVTLDPKWDACIIKGVKDKNAVHTMEVYDWDKFSKDDLIGNFGFVPSQLKNGLEVEIINEKKKMKKKKYKNSGVFVFQKVELDVWEYSLEYVNEKKELDRVCKKGYPNLD